MVKVPKPTKWLEPAKAGRPREGPPDGGDEWQPSRFWVDLDDGTFIDNLEGAQDVEFVDEPHAVREQENELVLKVAWYDPQYGEDEDWIPLEHLKPDFGRELKQLERELSQLPGRFRSHDLLKKYMDKTDEQSSQDERSDFSGPYGSTDDSDDVVSDDDTTWLDKLKKRKGPPQWPKEEAISYGLEQLYKAMPKGKHVTDSVKRGRMREMFDEAIVASTDSRAHDQVSE